MGPSLGGDSVDHRLSLSLDLSCLADRDPSCLWNRLPVFRLDLRRVADRFSDMADLPKSFRLHRAVDPFFISVIRP